MTFPAPSYGDPLKTAQQGYTRLLARRHRPCLIDGRLIDGLPDRAIRPAELRDLLAAAPPESGLADQVWRHLACRARTERGETLLVCAGLAMPALIKACRELRAEWPGYGGDFRDVESAILAGFFAALTARQDSRPGVLRRLKWAAHHAGRAYLRREITADTPCEDIQPQPRHVATDPFASTMETQLTRAVAAGVLSDPDASLIAATRLDGLTLAAAAAAGGRSYSAAAKARQRAEQKLASFLRSHTTSLPRACGHDAAECRCGHAEDSTGPDCPTGTDPGEVSPGMDVKGFIGGPSESAPPPGPADAAPRLEEQ